MSLSAKAKNPWWHGYRTTRKCFVSQEFSKTLHEPQGGSSASSSSSEVSLEGAELGESLALPAPDSS
jgi:hypothetical protein